MRCWAEKPDAAVRDVRSGFADAGLVIPAANATAAAVATVAAHALFTCLRKTPPGDEVPGEFPVHPAGGSSAHMHVNPPDYAVCRGVDHCLNRGRDNELERPRGL